MGRLVFTTHNWIRLRIIALESTLPYLLMSIGPGRGATEKDCRTKSSTFGMMVSCRSQSELIHIHSRQCYRLTWIRDTFPSRLWAQTRRITHTMVTLSMTHSWAKVSEYTGSILIGWVMATGPEACRLTLDSLGPRRTGIIT